MDAAEQEGLRRTWVQDQVKAAAHVEAMPSGITLHVQELRAAAEQLQAEVLTSRGQSEALGAEVAQARRTLLELSQQAEGHQEEKQRRQGELAAVLAVLQVRGQDETPGQCCR